MDLVLWVYVAEVLSVGQGLEMLAFFSMMAAVFFKVGILLEDSDISQKYPNVGLVVALVLCLWALFVPSKQGMYTLMAAYGVEQAVQSERVQEFAGKSLSVLEKRMDEYLEEETEVPRE